MFEGTTAIKTLHADSNLLMDSIFSTPVRLAIGLTKQVTLGEKLNRYFG